MAQGGGARARRLAQGLLESPDTQSWEIKGSFQTSCPSPILCPCQAPQLPPLCEAAGHIRFRTFLGCEIPLGCRPEVCCGSNVRMPEG